MLKKSEFLKSRKIIILLCVECFLILAGVAGLFGKQEIVAGTEETDSLMGEGIPLSPGAYTARVYYEIGEDHGSGFGMTVEESPYKTLLCNYATLYQGLNMQECHFYLTGSVEHLKMDVRDFSDSTLKIQGVEIVSGSEGSRIYLFWVILLSLILDGILMMSMYHRKQPILPAKQRVVFGIPALALLSSLPVMVDYSIIGADLVFHMMRIEALANSIRQGELAVRIESVWLAGHGYANSIFYGDTFLAVPALFRLIGFTPDSAYRMFVVVVNLATAWIAYLSFQKCFRSRDIGLFGSALYTLAPYRIYNIYNRAAVGEYTAMIFFPLLVWGFYKIYTEDSQKKGYLWNWVIPVVGFSGIIQSHTLSCEMVGMLVIFLCLILWKRTFRRRTFQVLFLTVVMTVVINAWFLLPFVDLMLADQYFFGHNANVLVQIRGILPAHWFYTLQAAGASSRFAETGMVDTEPIGIGAALWIGVILWLVLRGRHRRGTLTKEQGAERKAADIALFLGCVVLFMSSNCFPWDLLSSCSRLFATLNGSLQFPTRLTGIASICMVMTSCIAGKWALRENWGSIPSTGMLLLLGLVSVVFGSYQLNDTLLTRDEFVQVYSAENLGHSAVLGAEYLPEGTDISHMTYHAPVLSEGVAMTAYEKDGLKVEAYVEADGGYIEFPMLYYKGYEACVRDTGEKLTVIKGDHTDVRVLFPQGFSGEILVRYAPPWYWHIAEALSVMTGAGLLMWNAVSKLHKKRKKV